MIRGLQRTETMVGDWGKAWRDGQGVRGGGGGGKQEQRSELEFMGGGGRSDGGTGVGG